MSEDQARAVPAGWVAEPLFTASCVGCGTFGATASSVADLAVVWLVPDPRTAQPTAARFCRGCAPAGPVGEVECLECGDGPLLTGTLAHAADLVTTAAVDAWLETTGWRPAGPWCPTCVRVAAPAPLRR